MIQLVEKRDGRVVGYNEEKIKAAIRKAMLTTPQGEDEALIQKIADRIGMTGNERMTVEEIQDRVELELMKSKRKDVAKKYIAYRDKRSIARRAKTRDLFLEIIETKNNDVTRENANIYTKSANIRKPSTTSTSSLPARKCSRQTYLSSAATATSTSRSMTRPSRSSRPPQPKAPATQKSLPAQC